jgi:uncharacterized protein YcbK (DUF882 family)
MPSHPRTDPGCACASRRHFVAGVLSVALATAALPRLAGAAAPMQRRLIVLNTHTGEVVDAIYWTDRGYQPAELGRLDWVLRDHRSGDVLAIDRRLFDLLNELAASAGVSPRYQLISGYRSPATNAKLAAASDGVTPRSLHMEGRAIDERLEGLPTAKLRDLALRMQAGGVGYYPQSDFVHLDLGRVRSWSG